MKKNEGINASPFQGSWILIGHEDGNLPMLSARSSSTVHPLNYGPTGEEQTLHVGTSVKCCHYPNQNQHGVSIDV